jgi:glycosyltransferase involved in cell wall biosynthesis
MLIDLAPRKRGSLEDWVIAMVREASQRGHHVDVFGMEPIQPGIRLELEELGARWTPIKALQASWLRGISTLRQYDVIHVNMFASRHPISLMTYAAWPAAVLFVDHSSIGSPELGGLRSLKNRLLNPLIRARVSKFVGVSDFVRDRARMEMHLRHQNAVTIYNGVDLHRFAPAAGTPAEAFQIICVANLIPEKGLEVAIRALAVLSLPHYRLVVVGDGPNRDRLEHLAEELAVQRQIAFVGLRDDVHLLLRESHVFVHPAIWSEAFGLTITEAMASGCPIVASRVGAIPELVNHGEDGLLVCPGDPDELAHAVRLLHDDPELAGRLARNARRRVELKFSLERCVQDHIDLIERVAAERRKL